MEKLFAYVWISAMKPMCVQPHSDKTSLLKIQVLHDLPFKTASRWYTFLGNHINYVVCDFNLLGVLDQLS